MKEMKEGTLLRIFVGEDDKYEGKPLYEQIVLRAKELDLAGATVLRGLMGYGAHSQMHTAKILRLSENLPLVIEIVDTQKNLDKIMSFLDDVIKEGWVTTEKVKVLKYRRNG